MQWMRPTPRARTRPASHRRRTTRPWEQPPDGRRSPREGGQRQFLDTRARDSARLHRQRLPVTSLPAFVSNVKSTLQAVSSNDGLNLGSWFSCADSWVPGVELVAEFWKHNFEIPVLKVRHKSGCDNDANVQDLLTRQFQSLSTFYNDVASFKKAMLLIVFTCRGARLEWVGLFGGGFLQDLVCAELQEGEAQERLALHGWFHRSRATC